MREIQVRKPFHGGRASETSILLTASILASFLTFVQAEPAEASFQPIEILTSGYPTGANNAESTDMRFLAERSQRKTLTRAGFGPYTMDHDNADNSLDYSYVTDVLYGATSGTGHSSCTVTTSTTNSRACSAQLRESDVRSESGTITYRYDSITTQSAQLYSNGSINSTPRGGSGANTKDGFVTFASIFGPEVWSKPFEAGLGDMVSYEWSAAGGGDDYEIYGFLVKIDATSGCSASADFGGSTEAQKRASHQILSYGRGKTTRGKLGTAAYGQLFFSAAGAVQESGCYRFRLVNGSYDASGGYVLGATFQVRNLVLGKSQFISTSPIDDLIMAASAQAVNVSASSNISGATLKYTLVSNPASSPCSIVNSSSGQVTVDANKSGYCVVAVDSAATGDAAAAETVYVGFTVRESATAPVYAGGASVVGNATICSSISINEGSWANGGASITSTAYRWYRDGVQIAGETGSTYVISDSDLGKAIYFDVTKTNAVGSTTGQASPVTVVDARLTGLTLSGGALSPSFSSCGASYSSTVVEATISIVATANASANSLVVSGSAEVSGQSSSPIGLLPGINTISITVTTGLFSQVTTLLINYAAPPTVVAQAPTFTSGTEATLSALVNPNGFATSAILFSITPTGGTSGTPIQGDLSPPSVSGNEPSLVEQAVSSLISGGTYLFTVTATNANGTSTATYNFQTPDAPNVLTGEATNVAASSASISYTINTFNKSTAVTLSYGLSSDLSDATDFSVGELSGSLSSTNGVVDLVGLLPGRTYYFTFIASNDAGSNTGVIKSFLTIGAPSIEVAAGSGGERQMTLRAVVNPGGLRTSGIKFFYSTDVNFGTSVSVTATPSAVFGSLDVNVEAVLTNISAATYYFKAEATNDAGTAISPTPGQVTVTDSVPSVTLSAPAGVAIGGDITVIVRFSEAVNGFTSGDLVLSPGTTGYSAQAEQEIATGEYSVRLVRLSGSFSGSMTISLAANTATERFGSGRGNLAAQNISVFVGASAPDISIVVVTYNFTVSQAITAISPVNSGGPVSSWTITPSLPAGLTINSSTGQITGTPTLEQVATDYAVSATSAYGSDTLTINIRVRPQAPDLGILALTVYQFNRNLPINPISPANSGGTVAAWSITPSLPSGLSLNVSTGVISGTPSATQSAEAYLLTATNDGGSDSLNFSIEIFAQPPSISYAVLSLTFIATREISTLSPTLVGDPVSSWSITPSLPSGLTFNISTGEISGTPLAAAISASYIVTAENSGGTSTFTLEIEILSPPMVPSELSAPSARVPLVGQISPRLVTQVGQIISITGSLLEGVTHAVIDGVRYPVVGSANQLSFQLGRHTNGFQSIWFVGPTLGTYEIINALEFRLPEETSRNVFEFKIQRAGSELLVSALGFVGQITIRESGRQIAVLRFTKDETLVIKRRVVGLVQIFNGAQELDFAEVKDLLWFETWNLGTVTLGRPLSIFQTQRLEGFVQNNVPSSTGWAPRDKGQPISKFICTGIYRAGASNAEIRAARSRAELVCLEAARKSPAVPGISFFAQTKSTTSSLFGRVLVTLKGQK